MRANRSRDTHPEMRVRRALHALGLRYRVHWALPFDRRRRADIAFTRRRVAVFIDGCFWHGCPQHYVPPSTNDEYWRAKVAGNRARDRETTQRLEDLGWTVVRAWEHDDVESVVERVLAAVAPSPLMGPAAGAASPPMGPAAGAASPPMGPAAGAASPPLSRRRSR